MEPMNRKESRYDRTNQVIECSSNVTVSVCADLKQVVDDGSSSSSRDGVPGAAGNTTALTEILKPELPEMRTLPPLPEGEMTEAQSRAKCKQICELYPEVFDGKKGELVDGEAEILVKDGHYD